MPTIEPPPTLPAPQSIEEARPQPGGTVPPPQLSLRRQHPIDERVGILEDRFDRFEVKIDDGFSSLESSVRRLADKDRSTRWWSAKILAITSQLLVLAFLSWNGLINSSLGQKILRHVFGLP